MTSSLSVPPPLMVSEPGSFAEHTIRVRKPQIIADIISYNDLPQEIESGLRRLANEIASDAVGPLREQAADSGFWLEQWRPFQGLSWLELPWFFAETYFYRRVLEVTHYFDEHHPWYNVDPFAPQKRLALAEGLPILSSHLRSLSEISIEERFRRWLERSLWGNLADLSNPEVSHRARSPLTAGSKELLIDHSEEVWRLCQRGALRLVDWITDNCGLELLSDLGMADVMLTEGWVGKIRMHLKPQPYFVSDAMPVDALTTIEALSHHTDPDLTSLGNRLQEHFQRGDLVLGTDPFWATCLHLTQMPERLRATLAEGDLIILKGDVNYRRLLEDRHWPPDTSLEAITAYMPTRFLVLRTLKAELIVGLPPGLAECLQRKDPHFLTSGSYALVHLVPASQRDIREISNK